MMPPIELNLGNNLMIFSVYVPIANHYQYFLDTQPDIKTV